MKPTDIGSLAGLSLTILKLIFALKVELPAYFEPWNKLSRDLAALVKTHKLRATVDQVRYFTLFITAHKSFIVYL